MTAASSDDPVARLFVECWREAAGASPSDRSRATPMSSDFDRVAVAVGRQDDAVLGRQGLEALIGKHRGTKLDRLGAVLAVMRVIDNIFYEVHPRAISRAPAGVRMPPVPLWLKKLRDNRTMSGSYLIDDDLRLIPRGPLLRAPRSKDACGADYLADRFASLCCAPVRFVQEQRPIPIQMTVVGPDMMDGVMPPSRPGYERVAFLAVAEEGVDLDVAAADRSGTIFARYGPAQGLDVTTRITDGLAAAGPVDLALAPELVVTSEALEILSTQLASGPSGPSLLLAGTFNTPDEHEGQPFNEAAVMNGVGTVIWRQRKLWPASIAASDARALKLIPSGYAERVAEDNAAGGELLVADLDGFGRCVVFICQDIKVDLAEQVLKDYHPDWVLMPILDHGFARNRWAHRQAVKYSYDTQCRFVGVTSTSLAFLWGKTAPLTIGMAVGPADPEELNDTARASAIVGPQVKTKPAIAVVQWRSADFQSFNLPA